MEEKQTMTVEQASKILKQAGFEMSPVWLRYAIEQKQINFGIAVKCKKSTRWKVYRKKLADWIAENSAV